MILELGCRHWSQSQTAQLSDAGLSPLTHSNPQGLEQSMIPEYQIERHGI